MADGGTLDDMRRQMVDALTAGGIESAHDDARRLLCHALHVDPVRLVVDGARRLSDAEVAAIAADLGARLAGTPVSRIEGLRWFFGRPFQITPATLDPRADSECIVERALDVVGDDPGLVIDVGTGSGCLLISVLAAKPALRGLGTDVSDAALGVAAQNAGRHAVAARCRWAIADGLTGALAAVAHAGDSVQTRGAVALIIANPPYIPTADILGLDREVRDHDPHLALDGGADGLDHYRAFFAALAVAPGALFTARAHAVLEHGHDQSAAVIALARACGRVDRTSLDVIDDLGGHRRGLVCRLH